MIAPGITEIEPTAGEDLRSGLLERRADGLAFVNDESEVARLVEAAEHPPETGVTLPPPKRGRYLTDGSKAGTAEVISLGPKGAKAAARMKRK